MWYGLHASSKGDLDFVSSAAEPKGRQIGPAWEPGSLFFRQPRLGISRL